jgi:plastocyanin
MGALAFSPDTLTISLADGGQVLWRNADFTVSTYGNVNGTIHQVTANGATFDSGPLDPKGTFTFTFTSAGIYGYHCSIHPSMIGAIVVTP